MKRRDVKIFQKHRISFTNLIKNLFSQFYTFTRLALKTKDELYLSKIRKAEKQKNDRFTFFRREISIEVSVAIGLCKK